MPLLSLNGEEAISLSDSGKVVTAYIGIGSNIDDRAALLNASIELLSKKEGIEVTSVSSFYNTAPVGYLEQPDFLNAVVEIKTVLSADELLQICGLIEKVLKRERLIHWGPRTIDLDILLYGNQIINKENLNIPHPRMHERAFVLEPLNEINPSAIHPVFNKTVCELYEAMAQDDR